MVKTLCCECDLLSNKLSSWLSAMLSFHGSQVSVSESVAEWKDQAVAWVGRWPPSARCNPLDDLPGLLQVAPIFQYAKPTETIDPYCMVNIYQWDKGVQHVQNTDESCCVQRLHHFTKAIICQLQHNFVLFKSHTNSAERRTCLQYKTNHFLSFLQTVVIYFMLCDKNLNSEIKSKEQQQVNIFKQSL